MQIAVYNAATAIIIVDGLVFGRSNGVESSIYAVVKFKTMDANLSITMCVSSYDIADAIKAPISLCRYDVRFTAVPSFSQMVNHYLQLGIFTVHNGTTDEIQFIMNFIVEHLY